jgi:phage terminase small subunit
MKDRRSKPTHLKVITGNRGKRPLNAREPTPAVALPTCPAHICPSAKSEWKRLVHLLHDVGHLNNLHRTALTANLQAYGRWVEAERKLKETPAILKMP